MRRSDKKGFKIGHFCCFQYKLDYGTKNNWKVLHEVWSRSGKPLSNNYFSNKLKLQNYQRIFKNMLHLRGISFVFENKVETN